MPGRSRPPRAAHSARLRRQERADQPPREGGGPPRGDRRCGRSRPYATDAGADMTLDVLTRPSPTQISAVGGGPLQPTLARKPRRHVLDLDDFSVQEIEAVLQTTAAMKDVLQRPIKKVPTLRGKTLVTLFYESSTRTRVAFELAAKALGADTVSVAASSSSVTKGESLIDTIRTLQALGTDFVVMRHHQAGAPYVVAEEVSASVINAGDGWHAHPTQALL